MPATSLFLKAEPLRINTPHAVRLMWWKFAKRGFRANRAASSSVGLGIHKMPHMHYVTLNCALENVAFNVSLIGGH